MTFPLTDLAIPSTPRVRDVVIEASQIAQAMGEDFIGLEHIALAALSPNHHDSALGHAMRDVNVDVAALEQALRSWIERSRRPPERALSEGRKIEGVGLLGAGSIGSTGICVRLVPTHSD